MPHSAKPAGSPCRTRAFHFKAGVFMLASSVGVKVFTATKAKEREELGEVMTLWLRQKGNPEILDTQINQSSDNDYHCLSISLIYKK
jgi:hypothetical protein